MSPPSRVAAPAAPTVYVHASQPQWGRAVVSVVGPDRTTYVFENAGPRTFMNGHAAITEVPVSLEERAALAKKLLRPIASGTKRASAGASAKKAPSARGEAKKAPSVDAIPSITFERQLAIFSAAYPTGFRDPKFVREERGGPGGPGRRRDAGIALARDVLGAAKLDAAIAAGNFGEVFASAVSVLAAFECLSLPKAERPTFGRMPAAAHERFARALRDLLHGTGPYAPRFDAFVASLKLPVVPWTLATLFSAAVHPADHVFVKASVSQRQASALGLALPPLGTPSAAGYAQHLAVARALEQRLGKQGLAARDLFDVQSFGWRTLTRGAQASIAAHVGG